jgi:hypothetical protein
MSVTRRSCPTGLRRRRQQHTQGVNCAVPAGGDGSASASATQTMAGAAGASGWKTSFHHGITYTSYEVNTFSLKFNTSGQLEQCIGRKGPCRLSGTL